MQRRVRLHHVMGGPSFREVRVRQVGAGPRPPLPVSEVVVIAGVGRVDAKAYRALREAGEGMCAQVQTSCGAAWDGAPCHTARALWGGDAHKPR